MDKLDPGCGGKLLASKLVNDEIPQERYDHLREFVESLKALQDQQADSIGNADIMPEVFLRDNFVDEQDEDDDIEVCTSFNVWYLLYGFVEVM